MRLKHRNDRWAKMRRRYVLRASLNNTWSAGAGECQSDAKIEIVGEYHGLVVARPLHNNRIVGIARTDG